MREGVFLYDPSLRLLLSSILSTLQGSHPLELGEELVADDPARGPAATQVPPEPRPHRQSHLIDC